MESWIASAQLFCYKALYELVGPSPEHLYLPCREVFGHTQRAIAVLGPVDELAVEAQAVHADFW